MYYYNNIPLKLDRAFSDAEGNQYPANWLRTSTQEQRNALGITWVTVESTSYDQRFYWGPNNPKDLDDLKGVWVTKEKVKAGSQLSQTDWYIVRAAEDPSYPCPEEIKAERAAIRAESNAKEAAINATTTVEELMEVVL